MRFSVKCTFPHLGKRGAGSRKSALCNLRLTEKHTLQPAPHGKAHSAQASHQKAHSGLIDSRKGAVWAEGLADGAPWARPGHHQAAGCGLRRCRELRIILTSRETVLSAKRPPAKGRLRVRIRPMSHPGRGVLTSAQRLWVRSPSRPAPPLSFEYFAPHVHRRVAV